MPEQPERFDEVGADEVADAFVAAAREVELGIEPTAELIATLLAQSALETGNWEWLRNFNFGHFKATDEWVANGGDFVFFVKPPPHFRAPVSENMTAAQIAQARATSKPRTDGVDGPDMEVLGEAWPGVRVVAFWASHVQTRFRSFETLKDGAEAYIGKFLGRYRGALEPAARGDVLAYVTALRDLGPYFTADFTQYYLGVLNRYRTYLTAARAALAADDDVPALPNTGAFRSDPADIEVRAEGWVELESGVELTKLPLWDGGHELAARIGFQPVAAWLNARGLRLPTVAEMDELHQRSHFVPPVTKVFKASDTNHMMSHRWCAEHDAEVWRLLDETGWDGEGPVANFGKHWVRPSGTIFGWWKEPAPSTAKIQPPSTFHATDPTYADYATTVHAARDPEVHVPDVVIKNPADWLLLKGQPPVQLTRVGDHGPAVMALQRALIAGGYRPGTPDARHGPKTERAVQHARSDQYERWHNPADPIGVRTLHWLHFQWMIDPREVRGPEHHPLILSYSEHCRRGGRLLGVDEAGVPIWDGGVPLRAPSDEWEWCAIGQSAGLHAELRPGEKPPHGYRVAVRELVEDARVEGTLRLPGDGYEPKPGDLVVSGRLGESPVHGGRGHVEALNQRREPNLGLLLGGNEDANLEHGGRWRLEWESLDKAEAFIAR